MKYLDALSNGADNHLYNLHVGRMLLLQNKPEEALFRFQVAVGLKPTSVEARSVFVQVSKLNAWVCTLNYEFLIIFVPFYLFICTVSLILS